MRNRFECLNRRCGREMKTRMRLTGMNSDGVWTIRFWRIIIAKRLWGISSAITMLFSCLKPAVMLSLSIPNFEIFSLDMYAVFSFSLHVCSAFYR